MNKGDLGDVQGWSTKTDIANKGINRCHGNGIRDLELISLVGSYKINSTTLLFLQLATYFGISSVNYQMFTHKTNSFR